MASSGETLQRPFPAQKWVHRNSDVYEKMTARADRHIKACRPPWLDWQNWHLCRRRKGAERLISLYEEFLSCVCTEVEKDLGGILVVLEVWGLKVRLDFNKYVQIEKLTLNRINCSNWGKYTFLNIRIWLCIDSKICWKLDNNQIYQK